MARVDHKKVKQLIGQERKAITDRQFFSSRLLAGHFEDMAAAQTRRYGYSRGVRVRTEWAPMDHNLAHTNNELIWINAGHPLVTAKGARADRYELVCGLFAHELGHVLYTDFLSKQSYIKYFQSGRWYPERPLLRDRDERMHEADIWAYAKSGPNKMPALLKLACHIGNILEDGYIEGKMLDNYPGVLGYSLETLRASQFEKQPTLTQAIGAEGGSGHIWQTTMQLMLGYVLFGKLKYGKEPLSDERVQTVFALLPELDRAIADPSATGRWGAANTILVRCWPQIKGFLESCGQMADGASEDGGAIGGTPAGPPPALAGATSEPEGRTRPVGQPTGGPPKTAAPPKRAVATKLAAGGACTSVAGIPSGEAAYGGGHTGGGYAGSASDIERLLEGMAERAAAKQLETERIPELGGLANSISYGNIHEGANKKVHRIAAVEEEMKEQFHLIAGPLLHISKLLQRSVSQQLKDKRIGGKQTGLLMGRRLDAHALPRNDGRVFYKNTLPLEAPEMAIGLLLDESGSMRHGGRAAYARAAAIILYDFCRALRIPIMVYGHSTDGRDIDLYSYAEFNGIDGDDRYRMMGISARGGNRDGAALRYVAECLSRRPEEVKMLILVSDGQPVDIGYYGAAAEEDLRGAKHEYEKKGILFVAAAIGDDKANIERIYGDAFMDITDLNKLPVALANVAKRHMRV